MATVRTISLARQLWNVPGRIREHLEDQVARSTMLHGIAARHLRETTQLMLGQRRARAAACRAAAEVPAYAAFLDQRRVGDLGRIPWSEIPVTDKWNYAAKFPLSDRCRGGRFLGKGIWIDESSGSSGTPFDWLRGPAERDRVANDIARLLDLYHGPRPRFGLNAFALGAWGTGPMVAESMGRHGTIKNVGANAEKVVRALRYFGKDPEYFIFGYPPFMSLLADVMRAEGLVAADYRLHAMVGGEGMTEEFRERMMGDFRSFTSGYGATDLSMALAIETPEAVALRRFLWKHPLDCEELLGDRRLPMIFQYNPAMYYLETTSDGELLATLNHHRVLMPRIRYNIGDEARILTRREIRSQLGIRLPAPEELPFVLDLPFLCIYGRKDETVSVLGANIHPPDIDRCLQEIDQIAPNLASFRLSVTAGKGGSLQPRVDLEWSPGKAPFFSFPAVAHLLADRLASLNADYASARRVSPEATAIILEGHPYGTGPFTGRDSRIKNQYLTKPPPNA